MQRPIGWTSQKRMAPARTRRRLPWLWKK
jgi:hypothetical protein